MQQQAGGLVKHLSEVNHDFSKLEKDIFNWKYLGSSFEKSNKSRKGLRGFENKCKFEDNNRSYE